QRTQLAKSDGRAIWCRDVNVSRKTCQVTLTLVLPVTWSSTSLLLSANDGSPQLASSLLAVMIVRVEPTWVAAPVPVRLKVLSGSAAARVAVAALTRVVGTGNEGPIGLRPIIVGAPPVVVWFVTGSIVLLSSATRTGQTPSASPG